METLHERIVGALGEVGRTADVSAFLKFMTYVDDCRHHVAELKCRQKKINDIVTDLNDAIDENAPPQILSRPTDDMESIIRLVDRRYSAKPREKPPTKEDISPTKPPKKSSATGKSSADGKSSAAPKPPSSAAWKGKSIKRKAGTSSAPPKKVVAPAIPTDPNAKYTWRKCDNPLESADGNPDLPCRYVERLRGSNLIRHTDLYHPSAPGPAASTKTTTVGDFNRLHALWTQFQVVKDRERRDAAVAERREERIRQREEEDKDDDETWDGNQ